MNQRNARLKQLVLLAIFFALTLILGMTPLGLIPLGFINLTIMFLPVIIVTLTCGIKPGLILGAVFGLTSALSAFGLSPMVAPSALAGQLVGESPVLALIMCFLPRLMIPCVTWWTFSGLAKTNCKKGVAAGCAAAAGSLTNTILYLGLMLLFYTLTGLDSSSILTVIGGTGLIAGGCEAAAAVIISVPVAVALWKLSPPPLPQTKEASK